MKFKTSGAEAAETEALLTETLGAKTLGVETSGSSYLRLSSFLAKVLR